MNRFEFTLNFGWQITKHSQVVGKTGVGKSIFVKQQILKKDVIIISNKDCNLLSFKDVDKDFFYNLLIGLTKEKNLNNFFLSLLKQANNQKIKGIAVYIKKKFHNDFLEKKLMKKEKYEKLKIIKI